MSDRPQVAGYETVCSICPFRDVYFSTKNVATLTEEIKKRDNLIQKLSSQIKNISAELAKKSKKVSKKKNEEEE